MNRKVLLVEGNDSLRRLVGSFLSRQFEVAGAKNGLEAMSRLSQGFFPDAIVTDARAANFGGAQFLANLRCSGLFADIPVVVISSSDSEEEERFFKKLGAHDYFRKPFSPAKLQDFLLRLTN